MLTTIALGSVIILFLVSFLFFLIHKISIYSGHFEEVTAKRKRFIIAIINPLAHSQHTKGFISHLKKYASFEFEILECNAESADQAYKWAEYIAENNIDLVYTIGKVLTDIAFNVLKVRDRKIPIVSGAVPQELCETPISEMQKYHPIAGSFGMLDWPKRIHLLKQIFPRCKKVLVPFRSIDEISHTNLKEKNSISAALRKNHIHGVMHHISNIEKDPEFTTELLKDVDLIVISRSSGIMAHTAQIREAASPFGVPVFSTDTSSSEVFIGINETIEKKFGEACAKNTIRILEDNIPASEIALEHIRGPFDIVIQNDRTSELTTTTVISRVLNQSPYIKIQIK